LKEAVYPSSPLKQRIENIINNTQLQISKLDARSAKMKGREEHVSNKVLDVVKNHNSIYTKIFIK